MANLPVASPSPSSAGMAFAGKWARRTDILFGLGVMAVMAVLILPMPSWFLDMGLALSFSLAVLILMVALFIEKPLDFSSFPTILLVTTMLRLALNVASTRLILSEGYKGTDAAGHVIQAFGNFLMQGNTVIGIIVFSILLIVNFMVITKGSGRIAEVGARFSLDAMPGKQMAIDADLSAGLINEDEARRRRKELEDESSFFGSMDGAAKFVRGDAIAGLLITLINLVGGIIIGIVFMDLEMAEAGRTYTFLTIGDGLVTQIPALMISVGAGLLVTKSGDRGSTDKAVIKQLGNYPSALGLAAFLMAAFAMLPGIPKVPFLLLAALAAGGAWATVRAAKKAAATAVVQSEQAAAVQQQAAAADEPISNVLKIDAIRLELGYGLLPLIKGERSAALPEQIKALRRQLASEIGFVVPSVRIQDNLQLQADTYCIRIKEIETGRGIIKSDKLLVMNPAGGELEIKGEPTVEPTFGLPAMWIPDAMREEAGFKGYTVVEPATVLMTHLTEIIKDNMADLLSYAETQKLLDQVGEDNKKLVSDVIPDQMNIGGLQRVLQALLRERVSIRDLPTILEGIAEATGQTRNLTTITEHVRMRLSRYISESVVDEDGVIKMLTLSGEWEQTFNDALVGQGDDRHLALPPSKLQQFMTKLRQTFDRHGAIGEFPVLLTSPTLRPYVRSLVERFRPATTVLSQNEIHAKAKLKTVGQI